VTIRLWAAILMPAVMLLGTALAAAQEAPVPAPRPLDRMPGAGAPAGDGLPAFPTADPLLAQTAADAAAMLVAEKQPVHLTARITESGSPIPEGLVWRIFDTRTDVSGELALAAKSEQANAEFELPPGEYVIHVAYGRAQASDTLRVEPGDNTKAIILDAGALRLNAAVAGDVPIPINQLFFDVYTSGNEDDRTMVVEGASANDIITLNAGTYHVVSRFGRINAVVRADLRVEPGQMTDATLYHRAAQVSFKLVSETGGEAIAGVDWTVKDQAGETVFSDLGAFPVAVLAEGDYSVLAKRGEEVFNREFQIIPGAAREVEVLTAVY